MARIPLMLCLRAQLAPAWLRGQQRQRPGLIAVLAVATPVLLAVLLAVMLDPAPGACHLRVATGPGRPHFVCGRP